MINRSNARFVGVPSPQEGTSRYVALFNCWLEVNSSRQRNVFILGPHGHSHVAAEPQSSREANLWRDANGFTQDDVWSGFFYLEIIFSLIAYMISGSGQSELLRAKPWSSSRPSHSSRVSIPILPSRHDAQSNVGPKCRHDDDADEDRLLGLPKGRHILEKIICFNEYWFYYLTNKKTFINSSVHFNQLFILAAVQDLVQFRFG